MSEDVSLCLEIYHCMEILSMTQLPPPTPSFSLLFLCCKLPWCDQQAFLPQPMEVYVDDETKLTLHGLQQHYVKLQDKEKNRKLFDLMDALEFNQVRRRGCVLVEGVSLFRVCA